MSPKILAAVILWTAFRSAVSEYGCPEPEEISPCTCKESVYTNMQCVGVNDIDTVRKVFQNAARYHFNKFSLLNCTLQYIPHEVFDDVEVKYIDFDKVTFVNTFDQIPKNPGVKIVALAKVRILGGWDWSKLSQFTELRELSVEDMPMKRLSSDFRPNINKKLRKLRLSWCSIRKFRDDEFQQFQDLEVFTATHDELTTLKRTMFARPSKLRELGFEYNRIAELPEDMFEDMPDLTFISFNKNRLSHLPEATYKPVIDHLAYFKVFENPIKCGCLLEWIVSKEVEFLEGRCETPKKLHGKNLADLKPGDFRC